MTRAIIAIDYRPFFHASKMPVSFDDKKRSHISKIDYMPFGIKLLAYEWMRTLNIENVNSIKCPLFSRN